MRWSWVRSVLPGRRSRLRDALTACASARATSHPAASNAVAAARRASRAGGAASTRTALAAPAAAACAAPAATLALATTATERSATGTAVVAACFATAD